MAHVVFLDSTAIGLNAFRSAKKMGHRVTLVKPTRSTSFIDLMAKDPARLAPHLAFTDHYLLVDDLEKHNVSQLLRRLAEVDPIDAIISTAETGIVPASIAAEEFGTLYPSAEALRAAVFKNELRATLAAHGIRSPEFEVLTEADLLQGPRKIKLPFVVKPVRGFAKQFSAICRTQADFEQYVLALQQSREKSDAIDQIISHEYIVEEYVSGMLHSAETIVRDGRVMCYATTSRYRAHYYDLLELAAVMPSGLADAKKAEINQYLQTVFSALGIQIGLYHVELLMTETGPVLVEINARMMGSVSPVMYQMLTGQDAYEHLVRLHLGEPVEVNDAGFAAAGITLAVAARHGGRIAATFEQGQLQALLDQYGITFNTLAIEAGKQIDKYEGNLSIMGHVICTAETPEAVAHKAHRFLCELDPLIGLETAKYFA